MIIRSRSRASWFIITCYMSCA